jgi:site-specific recombinase XerD
VRRAASTPDNSEIVNAYLDWARDVKGLGARTVYQYEGKLLDYLDFIGPMPLADVSVPTLEAWIGRGRGGRAHGRKGEPATLRRDRVIVSNLYRYALARGWVGSNPTELLVVPPVKNKNPNPVSDRLWVPLWARDDLTDEARVLFGLGYFLGLRRVEMACLRSRQVDLDGLRLVAFARKGGGDDVLDIDSLLGVIEDGIADGSVPDLLPGGRATFLDPLTRLVRNGGDMVLPWRRTPDGDVDLYHVYRRFKKWGADFTPHQLRHAFVTNLLRVGVPLHLASTLANHSDVATTMRYAKLGGQDLRDFRQARQRRSRWESE